MMQEPSPVLFVLPDLGAGGAQKVMISLASALDRSRFTPRLLVLGGSQAFRSDVPPHVEVEVGTATRMRDAMPWLLRRIRAAEPTACVSVMGYLNLIMLALKPLMPRKARIIVREANALSATVDALPRGVPGRILYRTLYPRADAVVCPTREISDELGALSPRLPERVNVIPNPVDIEGLRTRAARPQRRPGPGLRFVSAGRLTRQKGYDQLIDMLPLLPDGAHVTVFGEGPDRAALERQAAALAVENRISFPGFTRELPAWIAGADAFLLPSRWEGLPNVVLESLALSTPAVISDEVAVRDLAREATPGAVFVRKVGPEFIDAALRAAEGDASSEARPSLLPATYSARSVIAHWEKLLSGSHLRNAQ